MSGGVKTRLPAVDEPADQPRRKFAAAAAAGADAELIANGGRVPMAGIHRAFDVLVGHRAAETHVHAGRRVVRS